MSDITQARNYFPRGLFQPDGAFRFSLDALLLAAFAARLAPHWRRLADLGCGVGPVAFASILLALHNTNTAAANELRVLGLDKQPELLEAASKNARSLGFEDVFTTQTADLSCFEPGGLAGGFDLVTANPPYRKLGVGRLPPSVLRREALFAGHETLRAFVRTGSGLLAPEGLFCLVFPFARGQELLALLHAENLELFASLRVLTCSDAEPSLLLLAAGRKNKGIASVAEKSLVLYRSIAGAGRELSAEALAFCPFLSCNARQMR